MARGGKLRAQTTLTSEARLGTSVQYQLESRRRGAQCSRLCRGEKGAKRAIADRAQHRGRKRAAAGGRPPPVRGRSWRQRTQPVGQRAKRERAAERPRIIATIVRASRA